MISIKADFFDDIPFFAIFEGGFFMIKSWIKENYLFLLIWVLITAAVIIFMFPNSSADYISYDSSYQYFLTQHSFSEIWKLIPEDYSPPFYAVALKIYSLIFGNSLFALRTFNLFSVSGMIFISLFPVSKAFGKKAGIICAIFIACSRATLDILDEIRPTIFGMFFMMSAAIYAFLAYFYGGRKNYILFTAFTVLCLYTHYVAALGIFSIYLMILIYSLFQKNYKKLKNTIISGIICSILYLPWLSSVLNQAGNVKEHYWIGNDAISFVIDKTLSYPFKLWTSSILTYINDIIFSILILISFILFLTKNIRWKNLKTAEKVEEVITIPFGKQNFSGYIFLMLEVIFPVFAFIIVNIFVYPLGSERYCFILGTVAIIFFSVIIADFTYRIINLIFIINMLFVCVSNNIYLRNKIEYSDEISNVNAVYENDSDGKIAFLHLNEHTLGLTSYMYPDAVHYVCDDTFTVLRTYDVFTTNVINIGETENIWDYTNECYIISPFIMIDYEEIIEKLQPDIIQNVGINYNPYSCYYLKPIKITKNKDNIK